MEHILSQYQYHPMEGAEAVLALFESSRDTQILNESAAIQGVVFGDANRSGPVTYFLEKAVEMQEAATEVNPDLRERFLAAKERYEELLSGVETAKILKEDPKGTQKYAFSFGTMTGSQLTQRIEDTLTQYSKLEHFQEGAQKLMDMFSRPQDAKILKESPNIRHRVLGGVSGNGPIDYFLDKAGEQLDSMAGNTHAHRAQEEKLEGLERRYETMRSEALGKTQGIRMPAASHMLRVLGSETENPGQFRQ